MIWIILILATFLRLININQSLWLDEAINVLGAKENGFWDLITKYAIGDFHPPGFFALLWIWEKIGGIGEIWVRLPSVIFGVLTVWVVYLLGKEMFSRKVGVLGALFLTLAPLHIYYSQEARMYSLACLSSALSFYSFYKLLNKDKGNWQDLGKYTLGNILVLYSDYLVYLIFPAQFIFLIFFKRGKIKNFLFSWFISFIAFLPWAFIFPKQLAAGTYAAALLPGWASIVGGTSFKELFLIPVKTFFGKISLENKYLYGLVASLVSLLYGFIILLGLKKLDQATKLLILWIVVPIGLSFTISFFIPVLSYFRMIFILPAFYLILAKGLYTLHSRGTPWRVTLVGICLISIISLGAYYINPKFQREDWRNAVKKVEQMVGEDGIVLFESPNVFSPFRYYANNIGNSQGGLVKIPVDNENDIKPIPQTNNVYLFEYLVDITDPKRLLEKKIETQGFKKIETLNFNGVGFVHHFILQ